MVGATRCLVIGFLLCSVAAAMEERRTEVWDLNEVAGSGSEGASGSEEVSDEAMELVLLGGKAKSPIDIEKELAYHRPFIRQKGSHLRLRWVGAVVTCPDKNFLDRIVRISGPLTNQLDEATAETDRLVAQSEKVKAGAWAVRAATNAHLAASKIMEDVVVVVQHQETGLIAMYHYDRQEDRYYKALECFLQKLVERLADLNVNHKACKVSLVSSYLSMPLLAIKKYMEQYNFEVQRLHVYRVFYTERDDITCYAVDDVDDYLDGGAGTPPDKLLVLADNTTLAIYRDDRDGCCLVM